MFKKNLLCFVISSSHSYDYRVWGLNNIEPDAPYFGIGLDVADNVQGFTK